MLNISLVRFGRKHLPCYEIRVKEARTRPTGKFVAKIGFYQPVSKLHDLDLKQYFYWVSQGAKPTKSVYHIYKKFYASNESKFKEELRNILKTKDVFADFFVKRIENYLNNDARFH